jgi:hypothetical protein
VNKENLLDLIRRVTEVSGVSVPIIVGSQSLYAATDQVPHICNLLDGRMILMAPLMERTEMVKETAYDGALIPRLQRFEAHLRSQRHVNYHLQPLCELLARLK